MRRHKGFTLMEMVIALVILGIISLAIGSYLQFGAQGYVGTVNRDRAQTIARFVLEKMTREVRHAAPNSVSTNSSGTCLFFYPVKLSGFYLGEPVGLDVDFVPTEANDKAWKAIASESQSDSYWMAVGLSSYKQYDNKSSRILTVGDDDEKGTLAATLSQQLPSSSPANRLYAYGEKVSYCLMGNNLHRLIDDEVSSSANLVAQNIVIPDPDKDDYIFQADGAGMNINGVVHIQLRISLQSDEISTYNHTVQVINVL